MLTSFLNTAEKWKILGSCCAIGFISNGFARTFSLFFVASLIRYGGSRQMTSFPFVLSFCVKNLISPLVSILSDKVGVRVVFTLGGFFSTLSLIASCFSEDINAIIIFIGLGQGIAFGLSKVLIPQVLRYQFVDHIDKAYGFFLAAGSIGGIALTPITEYFLHIYGLSGTFLLMAAIQLNIVPAALLLKKPKPPYADVSKEKVTQKNTESDCKLKPKYETDSAKVTTTDKEPQTASSVFRVFLDPTYIAISLTQSAIVIVYIGVWTLMVDASIDKGISREHSVQVLMSATVFDLIGRVCLGYFTDAGHISKINFGILCSFLMAVLFVLFNLLSGFLWVISLMSLQGFILGGYLMIGVGIVSLYVEKEHIRMANASLYFLLSPMGVCIPLIIGYFRDNLKSYSGFYYTLAAICIAVAISNYFTPALASHRDNRKKTLHHTVQNA